MKSDQELLKEFLEKGGQIEKLDSIESTTKAVIGSTVKGPPNLLSLAEAEELYGAKQNRVQKKKQIVPKIDMNLIPEHLHKFIVQPAEQENNNKGDTLDETK